MEYDGGAFRGWQSQKCGGGAQDAMLRALSPLGGRGVAAAGRTDSGVHAVLQIVHFDSDIARPPEVWSRAANDALPPQIRMLWAAEMPDNFHARHSAVRRRYHYVIFKPPAVVGDFAGTGDALPDAAVIGRLARGLVGVAGRARFFGVSRRRMSGKIAASLFAFCRGGKAAAIFWCCHFAPTVFCIG